MGLKEELDIFNLMKKYGLHCMHRLKQKKITDYIKQNPEHKESANHWLKMNQELPRESFTYEIDVFGWKDNHWGVLCVEEKSQCESEKTLSFSNDEVMLHNGNVEFKRSAKDLVLQCTGVGYLGKAFSTAQGMDRVIVPVAVVDYNINIFNTSSRWALHDGVIFVRKDKFEWFLQEFLEENWVKALAERNCN